MRLLILVLFGFASTVSLQAAELVEGVIYLKNGTRIEYTDLDRIALPKQNGTVRAYLHAFSKQKQKFTYQPSEIDSVVCWHPQAWEHPRRFYYAPSVGWCWVYFETPYIRVCVYAKKGYGIGTNGGILCWQRRGTFSSSRLAYYLQKKRRGNISVYRKRQPALERYFPRTDRPVYKRRSAAEQADPSFEHQPQQNGADAQRL